jgi:hypothetical protein
MMMTESCERNERMKTGSKVSAYLVNIVDVLSGRNGLSVVLLVLGVDIPRVELR